MRLQRGTGIYARSRSLRGRELPWRGIINAQSAQAATGRGRGCGACRRHDRLTAHHLNCAASESVQRVQAERKCIQNRQAGSNHINQRAFPQGGLLARLILCNSSCLFQRSSLLSGSNGGAALMPARTVRTHLVDRISICAGPIDTPVCRMCFLFLHAP